MSLFTKAILSLTAIVCTLPAANAEEPDSLRLSPPETGIAGRDSTDQTASPIHLKTSAIYERERAAYMYTPTARAALAPISLGLHPGRIAAWRSGMITGDVGATSFPGMCAIESGRISAIQQFGRLTVTAYAEAIHYGFYRGMNRSAGFGGSLSYQLNERVGLTVFGQYYTKPGAMPFGMAEYTSMPSFGGYVDYRISDHWGVKAGAQTMRSYVTNQWETRPMLIPYYRVGKGAELGIDVGGILYEVLKNNHGGGAKWGPRNPTIGPPDVIRAGAYRP